MRAIWLLPILLVASARALTVNEVIELSRAGIDDEVIIAQLRADGSHFRLTAERILALADEGLSNRLIRAMIETTPAPISPPRGLSLSERRRLLDRRPPAWPCRPSPLPTVRYFVPITYHLSPTPPLFVNGPAGDYPGAIRIDAPICTPPIVAYGGVLSEPAVIRLNWDQGCR